MEYPDLTQVMAKLGIALETVRSSELKAEPSPFRPDEPGGARASTRRWSPTATAGSAAWSAERRGLDGARLDAVANGAVFTGRLALEDGLIDEIGGEPEALAWLESRDAHARRPAGPRLGGRARRAARGAPALGKIGSSGGILGEISLRTAPKLYSIGP